MVMHAADAADTYIPHFCYHKKLSIAANCRMCLVDVEKAPKPMPACATPVTQGMIVRTQERQGHQGAAGRDGVPADQPSARLPDLRPGRRVPAAGPGRRLRRLGLALHRREARRLPQAGRPADLDGGDEPLHPLHALRALRPGSGRRDGARHGASRRARRDPDLRRPHGRLRAVGQHDRHLPGRRDHVASRSATSARTWELSRRRSVSPHDSRRRQPRRPGQEQPGAARRPATRTRTSTSAGSPTATASRTRR